MLGCRLTHPDLNLMLLSGVQVELPTTAAPAMNCPALGKLVSLVDELVARPQCSPPLLASDLRGELSRATSEGKTIMQTGTSSLYISGQPLTFLPVLTPDYWHASCLPLLT